MTNTNPETPGVAPVAPVAPASQAVCTAGAADSTVTIGSILNYSSTVYLDNSELPFNVAASFDPPEAQAPYTSTLTLDGTETEAMRRSAAVIIDVLEGIGMR